MSCAALAQPATIPDPVDQLDPPLRVYALAVREIGRQYNQEIRDAEMRRQLAVAEALEACEAALKASAQP